MGIKDIALKAAGKAGDAVAKLASLSPEQVEEVKEKRSAYLSEMPSGDDPTAIELTSRLIAAAGVEIHDAYLPQLSSFYAPIDADAEYGDKFKSNDNIRYLNITKWVAEPEENSLEKLVNVYESLANEKCNVALVFNRTKGRSSVYLAVVDLANKINQSEINTLERRLKGALRGNFPGSTWSETVGKGQIPCLNNLRGASVVSVSNIPSDKSKDFTSQTIEKLLDGIVPNEKKEEYTVILLATPALDGAERKLRLEELYTGLAPYASWQTNFTYTESSGASSSATVGINAGMSVGKQVGTNSSLADGSSIGSSDSSAEGSSESHTDSSNQSNSKNENSTIGASLFFVNASHTEGTAHTSGTSVADTTAKSVTKTLGKSVAKSVTSTAGSFASNSLGANFGANFARTSTVSESIGKNEGVTQTHTNFTIQHALELLQKQLKRLEEGSALGLWEFAAYVVSNDIAVAGNVAHSYLALTQGEESFVTSASVNEWRGDVATDKEDTAADKEPQAATICEYLKDLRHPLFGLKPGLVYEAPNVLPYPPVVTAATVLTGKELSKSLNFPKRSVAGLPVIECARFGRNVAKLDSSVSGRNIQLGSIFHMHRTEPTKVDLDLDSLASHVFVTGSTGSGKSNAVYQLLEGATSRTDVGYLVIEPAKGEYKHVFGNDEGVSVFGTNLEYTPLLRLNPFSFPEQIHVLEHLDRLVELFNVCWPMYAAMPAVLKDAVARSYEDCGWNLTASSNEYGPDLFPSFADVARNVREILDTSEYDAENKGAYKGSLLTRLSSLTNGINGTVFTANEIDGRTLFDSKTIVDLSRVGSSETKALLMGTLVLKLQEWRMSQGVPPNSSLRHLTVLEEAHNLLRNHSAPASGEGGDLAAKSVEMLTNAIAEMRTYGEGFIIADQAPGLLDRAVIRNTNTKIALRLPEASDRELVGGSEALTDVQKTELARLPRGVAAVYQNDWIEAVLCKVDKASCVEGTYSYHRCAAPETTSQGDPIAILKLLNSCEPISERNRLDDVRCELTSLGVPSSAQVTALKLLANPAEELPVAVVAPVISSLFPKVREAVVEAKCQSNEPKDWSQASKDAILQLYPIESDALLTRLITQAVVYDYVNNELHDYAAYVEWHKRGVLA